MGKPILRNVGNCNILLGTVGYDAGDSTASESISFIFTLHISTKLYVPNSVLVCLDLLPNLGAHFTFVLPRLLNNSFNSNPVIFAPHDISLTVIMAIIVLWSTHCFQLTSKHYYYKVFTHLFKK